MTEANYQRPQPEVVAIVLCHDEGGMLRQYFAKEEGLTTEQARRFYSDSILRAALTADPVLYEQWRIVHTKRCFIADSTTAGSNFGTSRFLHK